MKVRVTVLPGDGIGPEVTREALRVLRPLEDFCGCFFEITECAIGGAAIRRRGSPLPAETLDACFRSHAVFLGAVGAPEFDHLPPGKRAESGLLELRQALGGFANLRPARSYPALLDCSPLRPEIAAGVDLLVVRELLGGLYFGEPRGFVANGRRVAFNTMRYGEEEIARIAHIAFREARQRKRKVISVDKANVLETSRLWRQVVSEIAGKYPDVAVEHMYVDACATALVTNPKRFDVILTENLFGDILSDQAAGVVGSLGLLPSATLGGQVGLYEPVHGSAPDIAGKGLANPLGAIASMAMLLRHSAGLAQEASSVEAALEAVLRTHRTADLGKQPGKKTVSTSEMGELVERTLTDMLDSHYAYHAV